MKVFKDFENRIFLEVRLGQYITSKKGKTVLVRSSRIKLGLSYIDADPHVVLERHINSNAFKNASVRALVSRCLTYPEGDNMFYIISPDGSLVRACARKKEANDVIASFPEDVQSTLTLVSKAAELGALSTEALDALHDSMIEGDIEIGADYDMIKATYKMLEAAHNPKRKGAKPRKERVVYTGHTITSTDKVVSVREGTWRRFMIDTAQSSATTDVATATVNNLPEDHPWKGRRVDFAWLEAEGYITIA